MLRLKDVRFTRPGFTLMADLYVAKGDRVAVLGPSGSGKSTLLSLIAGFDRPWAGRILIGGEDVTGRAIAARPLSILFQDGNLFPHLTVRDNVALGIAPSLRLSVGQQQEVEDSLSKVGLAGFGDRKPAALSGGQQSRVALARMLLRKQPLALLDEPFAALDPGLRRDLRPLIRDLCAETGLTLVMVTHDLRDAEAVCDRLIVIEEGQIVLEGSTRALLEDPPEALVPWM